MHYYAINKVTQMAWSGGRNRCRGCGEKVMANSQGQRGEDNQTAGMGHEGQQLEQVLKGRAGRIMEKRSTWGYYCIETAFDSGKLWKCLNTGSMLWKCMPVPFGVFPGTHICSLLEAGHSMRQIHHLAQDRCLPTGQATALGSSHVWGLGQLHSSNCFGSSWGTLVKRLLFWVVMTWG